MLNWMQTCEDGPVALLHAWQFSSLHARGFVGFLCLPASLLTHYREMRCFLNFCGRLARHALPIQPELVSFACIKTPVLFCPRPCSRSSQNMGSLVVALSASGHIGLVSLEITRTSCDTLMRANCDFSALSHAYILLCLSDVTLHCAALRDKQVELDSYEQMTN